MKELSFEKMEELNGGACSATANKLISSIGLVFSVGACFGILGLAICGPTALGMAIGGVYCAFF